MVSPIKWQKTMWNIPKAKQGMAKKYSLDAASKLTDVSQFLKSSRSKIPQDGMVDAFLIAEYGRSHI